MRDIDRLKNTILTEIESLPTNDDKRIIGSYIYRLIDNKTLILKSNEIEYLLSLDDPLEALIEMAEFEKVNSIMAHSLRTTLKADLEDFENRPQ